MLQESMSKMFRYHTNRLMLFQNRLLEWINTAVAFYIFSSKKQSLKYAFFTKSFN
jgi:hypothetical protein